MQKFLRKVAAVSAAGLLTAGVAFAKVEVSNTNTGADSDNDNDVDIVTDVDKDVTNSAAIENEADATTETGFNEANQNTGGGEIDTGKAEIDGELENEVNSSAVELYTAVFGAADVEAENDVTGADSDNVNTVMVEQTLDVDLFNGASLLNALGVFASSGVNTANQNTGGGEIDTGDGEIGVEIMNTVNAANGSSSGSFGDVDIEVANSHTGADSDNENDVDVTQSVDVDVTNTAEIFNGVESSATTGFNEASKNTGGGMVKTGDAEADTEIENTVNTGGSGVEIELPDVDVEASNKHTGADSDNVNAVDVSNTADVDVTNSAEIFNGVGSSASSGDNEANKNTGGGEVSTGDASVNISISNMVN